MSAQSDLSKLTVSQFAERFRSEMIPLSNTFSYFCASVPMSEEELKQCLEEPVAALPPAIAASLPKISIILAPYLEKSESRDRGRDKSNETAEFISTEKPPENRSALATELRLGPETVLAFALKDQDVAEYHYRLYQKLSSLVGESWSEDVETRYTQLLREELGNEVHGEVDEASWRLKQALVRRKAGGGKDSKQFHDYARQSFVDTLTLYLHGICCDIDVDTGPRQLPSRSLRKRLKLLQALDPQPDGYAVVPEELNPR